MNLPYSITEARTALVVQAPFFASIMFERSVVEITNQDGMWRGIKVPTAMTDGRHIVINPSFFEKLTLSERIFVMCHEVFHLMSRHPSRCKSYKNNGLFGYKYNHEVGNICMDVVINKALRSSDIGRQPAGSVGEDFEKKLQDMGYTVTGEEAWEEVYKVLLDNAKQNGAANGNDGGQPGTEEATGGAYGDGQYDSDVGDTSTANGEIPSEAEMKASIASAVQSAKSRGKMPGGLKSFLEEFLEPEVDWREELRDSVVKRATPDSYTWSRPNRRKIVSPGIYFPRRIGITCGPIIVAVDTSGSVSDYELQMFMSELASILGDVRPERVDVLWCDAQIDRHDEVDSPEELMELTRAEGMPGRGGTSFIPPFEWVQKQDEEYATMIYMTDGHAPFPDENMQTTETIWVMSTDVVAPFGKTIKLDRR